MRQQFVNTGKDTHPNRVSVDGDGLTATNYTLARLINDDSHPTEKPENKIDHNIETGKATEIKISNMYVLTLSKCPRIGMGQLFG